MSKRRKILNIILGFSTLLLVLHVIASALFFYWRYWWFDVPMHLLGGFLSALIVISAYYIYKLQDGVEHISNHNQVLLLALVGALIIGILWEGFELSFDLVDNALRNYPLDTLKDIVMDVTGGYIAFRYFLRKVKQFNLN